MHAMSEPSVDLGSYHYLSVVDSPATAAAASKDEHDHDDDADAVTARSPLAFAAAAAAASEEEEEYFSFPHRTTIDACGGSSTLSNAARSGYRITPAEEAQAAESSGSRSPRSRISPRNREQAAPQSTTAAAISPRSFMSSSRAQALHYLHQRNQPPSLSWRLDPDESLSDWTLTVAVSTSQHLDRYASKKGAQSHLVGASPVSADDVSTSSPVSVMHAASLHSALPPAKKYYVHKTQLAVGPRRSEYFAKLFTQHHAHQRNHHRSHRRHSSEDDDEELDGIERRQQARRRKEERKHNKKSRKQQKGTRIELPQSAADAFPTLLDFIYSPPGTPLFDPSANADGMGESVGISTESAVALRHLASCLGIRELHHAVTQYIKHTLNVNTVVTYLTEAELYSQTKLLAACVKLAAEQFENVKLRSLVLLSPTLLEKVVRSNHLHCSSEVLCGRIASYCRCRPGVVDGVTLASLTDVEVMPVVSSEEALFLIHLLVELGGLGGMSGAAGGSGEGREEGRKEGRDDVEGEMTTPSPRSLGSSPSSPSTRQSYNYNSSARQSLASLYERCIQASPPAVRDVLVSLQSTKLPESSSSPRSSSSSRKRGGGKNTKNHALVASKEYNRLPSNVKVDLLESTLLQRRNDDHTISSQQLDDDDVDDDDDDRDERRGGRNQEQEVGIPPYIQTSPRDKSSSSRKRKKSKGKKKSRAASSTATEEQQQQLHQRQQQKLHEEAHEAEKQRMRETYETKLSSYKTKLKRQTSQLRRYESILSKFKRVPNDYRLPELITEHTYATKPKYDNYGENMYGYVPPTSLPPQDVVSAGKEDGWIYRDERWDDNETRILESYYWPMYYYDGSISTSTGGEKVPKKESNSGSGGNDQTATATHGEF